VESFGQPLSQLVAIGAIEIGVRHLMQRPPPGATPNVSTQHLQSLTPLRGIASLWVVLYHYTVTFFPNLEAEGYTHILDKGYLAVDMFFMLSGFVMTHVYYRAFMQDVSGNYRNFLVARVARLYPLHLLVLVLFVATALTARVMDYAATGSFETIPLQGARSFGALIANIFMLQGLKASALSWNYPAWSISLEFMAYLAFPFVLPVVWRARAAAKLILALLLFAALAWLAYLTKGDFNQWDGPHALLRCLPEFMLGTLMYSSFRSGASAALLGRDAVVLAVLAGTILSLHLGAPDLLIVAAFAVLILAAVANTGTFARALNIKPLIWLGDISYSLYLIHGLVQYVTTELLDAYGMADRGALSVRLSLALMIVMVAMCLLLAAASYYGVETAGRRYVRALFGVRRPAPVAGASRIRSQSPMRAGGRAAAGDFGLHETGMRQAVALRPARAGLRATDRASLRAE
jgi:peptidoglycan/LPS O-acetylase OafA/YrhL